MTATDVGTSGVSRTFCVLDSGEMKPLTEVDADQVYTLFVHEAADGSANEVDHRITSDDLGINPDGVLSPGETVTWDYWYSY